MGLQLHAKFEVSSIIQTSFRQVGNFTKNELLKSLPRLGLRIGKVLAKYQ